MAIDPLIRLVNLFELLSTSKQPLTQETITDLVPGFPTSPAARARAFERAKASLREIGIPVRTVTLPGRSQVGYRIDPEDFVLDLDLTRSEWAALEAALGCAVFVGQHGRHFESRLGLLYRQVAPIVWDMGGIARLEPLLAEAVAASRRIRFSYRGRTRDVYPFGVLIRWGHAYLVADEDGQHKSFRTDRIGGPYELGPHVTQARPKDLRSALPPHPWLLEIDQRVEVTLMGSRGQLDQLGATVSGSSASHEDCSVGTVEVSNLGVFLADLVMENPPVVPVHPIEIRERFIRHIKEVIEGLGDNFNVVCAVEPFVGSTASVGPSPSRRTLEERFAAVQGLLAYLRINGGSATIHAMSEAAGLPATEVVQLLESASLAGLPPYSPDVLLDVVVDEELDVVEASIDTELGRAHRIDVVEAMTVLATLEAVTSLFEDEDRELGGAAHKLRLAIQAQLVRAGDVVNLESPPDSLALLRRAIVASQCVEFDYTDAEGRPTHRHAVALNILVVAGRWYLFGLFQGKERHFRIDRMREITLVSFDSCHDAGAIRAARLSLDRLDPLGVRSKGSPTRLRLGADQIAKLESITGGVFDVDGDEIVVYGFRDEWMARLVLALGPGVRGVVRQSVFDMIRAVGAKLLARCEDSLVEGDGSSAICAPDAQT